MNTYNENKAIRNQTYNNNKATTAKQTTKKNNTKIGNFEKVMIIVAIIFSIAFMGEILMHLEQYASPIKYSLMLGVEAGNEDDIERYQYYIEKDRYLFDGPITIKMMAEKYDLDSNELYETYKNSECKSAQEFYEKFVKNQVK